jgi:tRNA pseudouridine38-40 synthase
MGEMRYLFRVYYIGSNQFHGSQRQKHLPTVENSILNAFLDKNYITNIKNCGFEMASRTDKHVSARANSFTLSILKEPTLMEINSILPKNIGLWAYTQTPSNFSSRYNAIYRHYKYILPIESLETSYEQKINLKLIKKACKRLEGTHDFSNFSKRELNEIKIIRTMRTMKEVSCIKKESLLIFDFQSKAFLRQQIRRMVAKILEVGSGKISMKDLEGLLNSTSYVSYQPVDPRGLILWEIAFGNEIKFTIDEPSLKRMQSFFRRERISHEFRFGLFNLLQQHNLC